MINIQNHFLVKEYQKNLDAIAQARFAYYQNKGHQKDLNGIRNDFERGFVGEIIAYDFLNDKVPNLSLPNFKLYDSKQKTTNYELDLKSDTFNFSVKTCYIDESPWSFSCNFDKKDLNQKFKPNDWFILVGLNKNNQEGEILFIAPLNYIKKNIDVTISPKLRKWKTAFYLKEKSLKDLNRNTKIGLEKDSNYFLNYLINKK